MCGLDARHRDGDVRRFADIPLAWLVVREVHPARMKNALVVDLDGEPLVIALSAHRLAAHQGNGIERCRLQMLAAVRGRSAHLRRLPGDKSLHILDVYNSENYPGDKEAIRAAEWTLPL